MEKDICTYTYYIYIETWKFIQEIRIHLRQRFFFAPGSAPELTELLDPPGKGDRGRSENRYQKL